MPLAVANRRPAASPMPTHSRVWTSPRRWTLTTLCLTTLLALAQHTLATEAARPTETERWYVLQMQGQRAGWMVNRQRTTDSGAFITDSEMHLKLERLGNAVELSMRMGSKESADGTLEEMRLHQRMGLGSVKSRYVFEDDSVTVITEQLGRKTEKTIARPGGDWLTPSEVEAFEEERIAAGDTEFSYNTIDVSAGLNVIRITRSIVGKTKIEVMGKTVPAIEWETTNSLTPGIAMREWVDDDGEMLRSSIDMGGITMEILAADEAFARSDFDAPELMASTLVHPDRPIESPRLTRRATYVLEVDGGELPDIPSAGAQRVERLDDRRARVTIDVDDPLPATDEEIADPRYREPSTTVDTEDPAIMALVVQATKEIKDAPAIERARAMERFVDDYISEKSLGVGYATASEVCDTREGDCSEHAVLLAAMLRADGIPSRGVSGLVYVDQFVGQRKVFGYHMWAQALVEMDGRMRWLDLDAAIRPMDATHIAITTSSLADNDIINSMIGVADVMNSLSISVQSHD